MRLGIKWLRDVASVNVWSYSPSSPDFFEGDGQVLYFQLVNEEAPLTSGADYLFRRYVPAAGATLQLTMDSIENAKKVVRSVTQPFSNDPSIWQLTIGSTDPIRGTVDLRLSLNESGTVHSAVVKAGLRVRSTVRI